MVVGALLGPEETGWSGLAVVVVCAVRMPAVMVGSGAVVLGVAAVPVISGCVRSLCHLLCGVVVLLVALGCGCGGWLGPLGIEPLCWLCGSGLSGLGLGFPVG